MDIKLGTRRRRNRSRWDHRTKRRLTLLGAGLGLAAFVLIAYVVDRQDAKQFELAQP